MTFPRTIAPALCAALVAVAQPVFAQTKDDAWQFQAILYGWFPDISGQTRFATASGSPSIDVDISTILKHLDFTFMGTFDVRKGRFGAMVDVIYMDVSGSKSQSRDFSIRDLPVPADVSLDANLDLKSTILTLGGTYAAIAEPNFSLEFIGGARLLSMKQELSYQLTGDIGPVHLPGRAGSSELKVDNWDGIVGFKGRLALDAERKWFVPYYLDVGTGDSKFTWQGIAGLGYTFGWGDVIVAWRYLEYEFKSSSPVENVHFSGPGIGASFRW